MTPTVPISKRLVMVNAASCVAARLINITVLVWLHQYLINEIGQEDYAIYTVIMALIMMVPLMMSILTGGLSRYTVDAYARGDEQGVTEIVSSMFVPLVVGSASLLVLGGFAIWYIEYFINVSDALVGEARAMLAVFLLFISFRLVTAPWCVGLIVKQKFILINIIQVSQEVLRLALLFALLFGVSNRVLWVVVATASAAAAANLVTMWLSRRYMPSLRYQRGSANWDRAKVLLTFGSWNFVGGFAEMMRRGANPFILNRFATSHDVACFGLGSLAVTQIQAMVLLAAGPLEPALTAMHATGGESQLQNVYIRGGRYGLWVVMMVAAPLLIYRRETIALYVGPDFGLAAAVMGILLLELLLHYGNNMLGRIARAKANIAPLALRLVVMQAISVLLAVYLVGVRNMGALGSAVATLAVAVIFHPLVLWPHGWKIANVRPMTWVVETLLPGLIPTAASALVWVVIRRSIAPQSWGALALCVAIGLAVYFAVLIKWCLSPYDRNLFASAAARLWRPFQSGRSAA